MLSVVSYDIYRRGRKKTFAYQFGKGQVLIIVKSKKSKPEYFSIYPGAYSKYTSTCILGMSPETFEVNLRVGVIIKNF